MRIHRAFVLIFLCSASWQASAQKVEDFSETIEEFQKTRNVSMTYSVAGVEDDG